MKSFFAGAVKSALCLVLIVCLCGCWNSRELNTLGIVMGVGVDMPEEMPGGVSITAQLIKPADIGMSKSGGADKSSKTFWNVNGTGETVFDAVRDMTDVSSRRLFYPHSEVLIFGWKAAQEGVSHYIDFFRRDHETRDKVSVLISETTASAVLDTDSELEKIPASNIAMLVEKHAQNTSHLTVVNLLSFTQRLLSDATAPIAPVVGIARQGDKDVAHISGLAVFKKDKLAGVMSEVESRGLMWVLNEIRSGVISVKDQEGNNVGLEIIRAKGRFTTSVEDGKITVRIKIIEEGNLADQAGGTDFTEFSNLAYIEGQAAEKIRYEVEAALEKARELGVDPFGFGESVRRKYPDFWDEIKDDWDKWFQTLNVEIETEAHVRLMGRIGKPTAA